LEEQHTEKTPSAILNFFLNFVADFKAGKKKALNSLVGAVMKKRRER